MAKTPSGKANAPKGNPFGKGAPPVPPKKGGGKVPPQFMKKKKGC